MSNTATLEKRPAYLDFLKPWEEKMGVTAIDVGKEEYFDFYKYEDEAIVYSMEDGKIINFCIASEILSDDDFINEVLINLKECESIKIKCSNLCRFPTIISTFNSLKELCLLCYINSLPESFGNLSSLEELVLWCRGMTDSFEFFHYLISLEKLWLCHLHSIKFPQSICDLPKLKQLYFFRCEFESIPKEILKLNSSFSVDGYSVDGYSFNEIEFDRTNIQEMDINIFKKSRKEIEEYYKELEREKIRLDEARIILIGNGDAGKSSIINRLITGNHEAGFASTKGIAITPWSVDFEENRKVLINFWDFGGQEIMHSMHEFFMSERCLYVIVLNGRKDEQPEKWLDLVRQYGNNSPVMIVINQIDENRSADVDRRRIGREYGQTFGEIPIHRISCQDGDNFDEFKTALLDSVKGTKTYNKWFPGRWYKVKLLLTEMKDNKGNLVNYITEKQFREYCEEVEIENENEYNQSILLNWLDNMGVCFSYESKNDSGAVEDTKVLRPEWITNGIYKIINSEEAKEYNGFLKHETIKKILLREEGENPKYRNIEKDFIIGMLRDFSLSYAVQNEGKLYEFIPMLAPKSEPELPSFNATDDLNFIIEYNSRLPLSILYSLVVSFIARKEQHLSGDLRSLRFIADANVSSHRHIRF